MQSTISAGVIRWLCIVGAVCAGAASAEDDLLLDLKGATERAARQSYQLRYQFHRGETVRYKVVQLTATNTRVGGILDKKTNRPTEVFDKVQTRSISTKAWKVVQVNDEGHATFVHTVEDVDMWSHIAGRKEVRYNSKTDAKPPKGYEGVAKNLGQTLATITIDSTGKVLKRVDKDGYSAIRGEQIVDRLPPQPVRIGDQWFCPHEIIVADNDGRYQRIKTRKLYRLEKVSAGVATIHVQTQVLTPIHSPAIEAKLVKWLTEGNLKLDLDAGRVLSLELNLDKTVMGFAGPNSRMEYLARRTETLLPSQQQTAQRKETETERK
jgi:hypothetical protein